jgi:Fe-S cluster biogenesis protein NfuA
MTEDTTTLADDAAAPADDAAAPADGIDLESLNATLEYIRPALQADGGDLILLGVDGGRVNLQLVGACGGCPMSTMTLTAGIERILQDRVAGVTEVVAI